MYIDIIKQANAKLKVNEGDYYEDGLLHCGTCRKAKQKVIDLFGEPTTVRCMCQCESDAYDEDDRKHREQDRLDALERRRINSFDESRMTKWVFAEDDRKNVVVSNVCENYAANFDVFKRRGKGLLLYGKVGVGKSFYAACIANALISNGKTCLMTTFSRLELQSRSVNDKQAFIDRLRDYDLLVIDDLSAERNTEYMNEFVQMVIDARYRSALPLIVTTNLSGEEMQKVTNDIVHTRLFSRLYDLCIPVEVRGDDRRKKSIAKDNAEMMKLLGLERGE